MKALVVYESLFGNTAKIGEAVTAALASHGIEATSGPVSKLEPSVAAEHDLVVLGGPTHAHGMSSKGTRQAAVQDKDNRYDAPTVGPGLRDWIRHLPSGSGRLAAAFDTRFDKPRLITGSAARGIAKRLEHQGYRMLVEPESFFVTTDNDLAEGQIDHAGLWGAALAERASAGAVR